MVTVSRAVVKVTLGWEVAYEFEVWIMPHHAGVDLILGTDFMIPAGIRLDLYNSAVKLPDEMVIPLIGSSNAPTKTKFGPNDLSKFEDDGAISDVSTNSAVEGTSAVAAKEEASATEDSAITEGDPEERSEQVLRDAQPVFDDRAKFGVIRPSIVGEVSSAMSTLTTISAGINHVVTANSALEEPAARNDLGAVPACHRTTDYARDECGRVDVCPAVVADSAVQRPSVTTENSKLEVLLSRDVEANSEGLSWTVNTSNHSLKRVASRDKRIDIQGIRKDRMVTVSRAVVKVTLGWEVAYEFEVWIMPHHAGVDLILGTDFMIPAGIRLDLYNSAVKLPDEMVIPLIGSSNAPTKTKFGPNVPCGPRDGLTIESRMTAEFKLPRRQPSESTHDLWV
ncbi:hypothetical protein PInf_012290 [Phytophthora infestans]|nr:hypothetical protein PInf_012290 [Phytophthora infestans]